MALDWEGQIGEKGHMHAKDIYHTEADFLTEKPRLGEKFAWAVLDREKPAANDCCVREKSEVRLRLTSGQTLYTYVLNNPINWVDSLGLYVEVLIGDTTSHKGAQFGHAAIDINGTVYSRGHSGWFTTDRSDYLERQGYRDTVGLLLDTTWDMDDAIESSILDKMRGGTDYNLMTDSCSSNIADALGDVGIDTNGPWQFGTVSPMDLITNLPKTGKVTNRYFYGRTR